MLARSYLTTQVCLYMNTKYAMSSLLALSSLSLVSYADNPPSCDHEVKAMRFSTSHIEGKGIGYNQGYTSFDLFIASKNHVYSLIPFLDLRAHVFNNGNPAFNAGLGLRLQASSWVFGFSNYYDYRKTDHYHYQQYSLGLEALGKHFDIRCNGYLPIGKKSSGFYHTKFSYFENNFAYLSSKREFAMKGINLEGGYHFKDWRHVNLYTAAGPYYFYSNGLNAIGAKARVAATIYKYLKLEVSGSYDPIFYGIGQGEISIQIPFGAKVKMKNKSKTQTRCYLAERAMQKVDRNEIIVVDNKRFHTRAINPATNSPYFFHFIDNTSHSLGTYESPYPTIQEALASASEGNILYIFPGSGSPYNVQSGIALEQNQKLWGSSTAQHLPTTLGAVFIPPQTTPLPLIQGGQNPTALVTLNNNNEISGLHLNGGGANNAAIYGILGGDSIFTPVDTTISVAGSVIQNNTITGFFTGAPLRIVGEGTSIVMENTIEGKVGNGLGGVDVYAIGGQNHTAFISNNQVTVQENSLGTSCNAINIQSLGPSSVLETIISSNILLASSSSNHTSSAINGYSTGDQSSLYCTIYNNSMRAFAGGTGDSYGIVFLNKNGAAPSIQSHISSNNIESIAVTNGSTYGIYLESDAGSQSADILLNKITSQALGMDDATGIEMYSFGGSLQETILSNTLFVSSGSGSYAAGIYGHWQDGTQNASIINNAGVVTGSSSYKYAIDIDSGVVSVQSLNAIEIK